MEYMSCIKEAVINSRSTLLSFDNAGSVLSDFTLSREVETNLCLFKTFENIL